MSELTDDDIIFDILCFTETFIKEGDEPYIKFKNFNLANSFCRKNEKRGGVCLLVRKSLEYIPLDLCQS